MRFIIIQIGSDSMSVMSDIMAGPVHDIRIQSLGPEQRFRQRIGFVSADCLSLIQTFLDEGQNPAPDIIYRIE